MNPNNKEKDAKKDQEIDQNDNVETANTSEKNKKEEVKEKTVEEKLKETEEKLLRSLAEIENQRRRFEKEIKDAFEFGSFNFAKESLSSLDNLLSITKASSLLELSSHENIIRKFNSELIRKLEGAAKFLLEILSPN